MGDKEVFNILVKGCLEAVSEQYVLPLMLALGTLTAAVCRDPKMAEEVADALRRQAASCPPDVAGGKLLEALAGLAAGPLPPGPDGLEGVVRKHLRLVHSQNPKAGPEDRRK